MNVVNNSKAHRFEISVDGHLGFLTYAIKGNRIRLIHTEVPPPIQHRGFGTQLAEAALHYAQREQLRVVPICPFVRAYLTQHAEYGELVD